MTSLDYSRNLKTVWYTESLSTPHFVLVNRAKVISYRSEFKSLGAAVIQIVATDPNFDIGGENLLGIDPGGFIAIVHGDTAPGSLTDENIKWFGYVESTSYEIGKNSSNTRGDIACLEIGHWLKKLVINHRVPFESYNPTSSDGLALGNRDGSSIRIKDIGYLSSQLTTHYWTVDQAIRHGISQVNTGTIALDVDRALIPENDIYIDNFETLPSGEGMNPIDWISDALGTYEFVLRFDSESVLSFVVFNPNIRQNGLEFTLPEDCYDFVVQRTDDKYSGIKLIGDRIQINYSVSAYNEAGVFVGIDRMWSDESATTFVQPDDRVPSIEALIDGEIDDVFKTGDRDQALQTICNDMQSLRANDRSTYQEFRYLYGNFNTPETSGSVLWTTTKPGDLDYGDDIVIFPQIVFQNNDGTLQSSPQILSVDKTPSASEFDYPEGDILIDEDGTTIKPGMFYRALGYFRGYGSEDHWAPYWYSGTEPTKNGISFALELDWYGIRVESPYPETLASPEDDLFREYLNGSWTAVEDYGVQRDEWDTEDKSASSWDPEYFGRNVDGAIQNGGIGHWKRLIFTLAAKSAQRLEIKLGDTDLRPLTIYDDSYKVILNRRGTVIGLERLTGDYRDEINRLKRVQDDTFVRNDAEEAFRYATALFEYYSKQKAAVRFSRRLVSENAETMDITLTIGDFVKRIYDGDTFFFECNSTVSSIEYIFESTEPRMIISTEIPASPKRTRERRVRVRG
jgi:hypothetical protein